MYSRKQERINVLLVGKADRKHAFIREAGGEPSATLGIDVCNLGDIFRVWDLAGIDNVGRRPGFMCNSYLNMAQVIIYLDPTQAQKEAWEEKRNENECIAIDFDAMKTTPEKCFMEIENLILEDQKAKQKAILDKGVLLLNAKNNNTSYFSFLPNKLIGLIGCSLFSVKGVDNIFIKSEAVVKAEKANLLYKARSDNGCEFSHLPVEIVDEIANNYMSCNENPVYGSFKHIKSIFTALPPKPKTIEQRKEDRKETCSIQ